MRHRILLPVDRNHAVNHFAFPLANPGHIHGRGLGTHSVRRGATDQVRHLGTSDHVLAWQAGDVWTRTSNQRALDHDDGPTQTRQFPCEILTGLTSAQDGILDVYGSVMLGLTDFGEEFSSCGSRLIGERAESHLR